MKDHESRHGNETHHSFTWCHIIEVPLRTRHQSKHHVRKHRSTAVHNNGFNVRVGELFQHHPLCPSYVYFTQSFAGNICILFTLPTPLFALLIVLHRFFPHLVFSTLHGLNSGVTRSALFIIVYLERTCFIRQAVLPYPIDCKASVHWIVEWGDGKRRGREGEKVKETRLYLQL